MQENIEKKVVFEDREAAAALMGERDAHLAALSGFFSCQITSRGDELVIRGSEAAVLKTERTVRELLSLHKQGNRITLHEVRYGADMVESGQADRLRALFGDTVFVTAKGRPIKPKTIGQKIYLDAIRKNEVTFGIGPAGTGKTYLAVVMAVNALRNKEADKIILTRPAVEAGERLGFLPGDLQEKVDPYLRPLYDALQDLLGAETYQKLMAKRIIEVAPLAYMRGRTLEDAFVILDEAQNTTGKQMKMFLTRLGFGSKMVVTGDLGQVDLPRGTVSGLAEAKEVLKDVEGVKCIYLNDSDVIRHDVVARIIRAYDRWDIGKSEE